MTEPEVREETVRPWTMLAVILAAFFGLALLTLLLPHDPYVRYQQLRETLQFRAIWTYERIALDETPIDIAIIGNSRLQSAISAPVVQNRLEVTLGRPVHVANLSLPQEGRNAHYAVARELFKHHPEVKLLILSAIEAMPRDGHPAFRNIAEADDIVAAPAFINRDYVADLAFIPFRQVSLFLQTAFPDLFGIRNFDDKEYWGSNYDTTTSFVSPTGGRIDRDLVPPLDQLTSAAQQRVSSITPPILPHALASREFAIEHHYTRAIADLAKAHGTDLAFLYTPIFNHPVTLREEAFYLDLGRVYSVDCVAKEAGKYSDYGHVSAAGARDVSALFAETLARTMSGGEPDRTGRKVSLCE